MGEFKEYLQKATREKMHDGALSKLRKEMMKAAEDGKGSIKILFPEPQLEFVKSFLKEEGLEFDESLDSSHLEFKIYRLQIFWA